MLELNKWFFVLLVNFLVLLYVLNIILFKPLLKLFKEREDNVNSAHNAAKDMIRMKEEAITRLNTELAQARDRAKEVLESLMADGGSKQKEMLSKAEAEASETIQKATTELKAETEKVRQALRADMDKFSDEIVRKLIKV